MTEREATLTRVVEGYGRIIAWMLGEHGPFPLPPDTLISKGPLYWWRAELRKRANAVIAAAAPPASSRGETP